ncbi:PTS sugar transporter subunit IIA [Streptococcus ratti]|uniref:PTS transporter subunit EIIA n=1 Tax=Streptococcus ratti TaxID=1341 RepID=A0A7X9LEV6_STRRT|nr:fructose PTS transporter subunit IIA [Streptococcus ratti]NMD49860.1 PTS transporter subunit EIIA [Streptococcus ratti]
MIDESLIKIALTLESQEDVFHYLSELVVKEGYAKEASEVLKALQDREAEGSTGMMDGFAIPHAKSSTITKPGVALLKLAAGINWESMDGKPTQHIVALFIPETEAGTTHLKLLSQLARLLMKDDFKKAFEAAQTPPELKALLEDKLSS